MLTKDPRGTCHAQVPGYIENFERFKEKGVDEIYIVAVNDAFTVKYVGCLFHMAHIGE